MESNNQKILLKGLIQGVNTSKKMHMKFIRRKLTTYTLWPKLAKYFCVWKEKVHSPFKFQMSILLISNLFYYLPILLKYL